MKLHFKYDFNLACKTLLQEQLDKLQLDYELRGPCDVELNGYMDETGHIALSEMIRPYGMEVVDNQKHMLIRKTKSMILDMINEDDRMPTAKIASLLASRLNHSSGYLSKLFTEYANTSIENYIIIHKIERVKKLLLQGESTLTDISFQFNYSSVAHLSNQFKKLTGLTPTAFVRIQRKREEVSSSHRSESINN